MYVSAIVLAAGAGIRLKSKIPKALLRINSQPIIIYSLKTLDNHPYIRDIILVANSKAKERITAEIKKYRIGKITRIVKGGRRRQDSVYNGLRAMDNRTDLVLIHDAARPFVDKGIISATTAQAKKIGAAIAGVPVKATIKKIKNQKSKIKIVEKTVDRDSLWEVQTPQVFKKDLILKAYKKFKDIDATDDASLVEKLAASVAVVMGSYNNIKITTPEDLILARAILISQKVEGKSKKFKAIVKR